MLSWACKPHSHTQPSRGGWHKTRGLQLLSMPKGLGKKVKEATTHWKYTRNTFLFTAATTEGITDAEKQLHSFTLLCTSSLQSPSPSWKVAADQTFLDGFQTLRTIKAIWAICRLTLRGWITPAPGCPPPPFQADSPSTSKERGNSWNSFISIRACFAQIWTEVAPKGPTHAFTLLLWEVQFYLFSFPASLPSLPRWMKCSSVEHSDADIAAGLARF